MLDVFKLIHDNKIYNLCDDNVKNNVNFIIKLMEMFKDDRLLGVMDKLFNFHKRND